MVTRERLEPTLPERVEAHIRQGLNNLSVRQNDLGSWSGDYGGPLFLLPMYVALCRIAAQEISEPRRRRMVEYLENVQNADGSWGLHCEGAGQVFPTALNHVALRLLGAKSLIFVKDQKGLYTDDPELNPNAKFIPEPTVDEILEADYPHLIVEEKVIEYMRNGRSIRQIQIINGLEEGNLERALNGEHVGTIIRA